MRFGKYLDMRQERLFIGLAVAGFVVGLVLMNIGKRVLLEDTGLLSEYILYEMKYSQINSSAFFWYVLRKRMSMVFLMTLLATTWLGVIAGYTYSAWLGISFGMLMMAAVIRYGVKGILLILIGIFPQGLIYLPACFLLLNWCRELCLILHFSEKKDAKISLREEGKNNIMRRKALQFLSLVVVVIIGCTFESYVNPKLVLNLLQFF